MTWNGHRFGKALVLHLPVELDEALKRCAEGRLTKSRLIRTLLWHGLECEAASRAVGFDAYVHHILRRPERLKLKRGGSSA